MTDALQFIFSTPLRYAGTLVILWMVCPWLHMSRKKHFHIFGTMPNEYGKTACESALEKVRKEEQFTVKG